MDWEDLGMEGNIGHGYGKGFGLDDLQLPTTAVYLSFVCLLSFLNSFHSFHLFGVMYGMSVYRDLYQPCERNEHIMFQPLRLTEVKHIAS
ncbi:hypothetical protein M440DRAFT_1403956 [Trichoderma longibrachiatum ATCC 18648]|uniref:Uncharacterized protein n=1 Tax=Trichoderma longibrachiatum ATCC 18648 TaxID=983965 RepID=A0A2T4BWX9_TRILO|nr:hypothetical protein M440DRAFT_1403956 [Trichoderma longibrachiatum ATCC 18648]